MCCVRVWGVASVKCEAVEGVQFGGMGVESVLYEGVGVESVLCKGVEGVGC